MNPRLLMRRAALGGALSVAALALAGCVLAPVGPYPGEVVGEAPPPPRVEIVGVAPYPGWLWIGGYWGWGGARYVWTPGRWEAPRPGYRWQPHQWQPDGRGWRERPGRWERDGRY